MLWIVIGGALIFAVVAWARASRRRFEADQAARREESEKRRLDAEEASLLARLRDKQGEEE